MSEKLLLRRDLAWASYGLSVVFTLGLATLLGGYFSDAWVLFYIGVKLAIALSTEYFEPRQGLGKDSVKSAYVLWQIRLKMLFWEIYIIYWIGQRLIGRNVPNDNTPNEVKVS